MFLVPLPQGPRCFSNVLLTTAYGCALVTVNDTTLPFFSALVSGLDQYLFDGPVTFEMCLDSIHSACVLDAFP